MAKSKINYDPDVFEITDDYYTEEVPGKGLGVFANRDFVPGEIVLYIPGVITNIDSEGGSSYCMEIQRKGYVIEPYYPGALVNHSCNPNCELKADENQCWITAIAHIRTGQELSYDYGWNLSDLDFDDIKRCRCGSLNCRGFMLAAEDIESYLKMRMKRLDKSKASKPQKRKKKATAKT
jgi:hypothetical protein